MKDEISFFSIFIQDVFMINRGIDTVLYGNQILFFRSENTSFAGRDSLFFAWSSPLFMIVLNSLFEKLSLAKGVVDFSLRSEGIFTVSVVVLVCIENTAFQ